MNKYEGIGVSAIKYAVLNLVLIFNNLLLIALGPDGGGTGDREEGLSLYTIHWFGLVFLFVSYGLYSMTTGRAHKKIRSLTALPFLVSPVCIIGVMISSQLLSKKMYQPGGFYNDLGLQVLQLNVDALIYLIYALILFAVSISIAGIISRTRFSVTGLIMNLALLCIHFYFLHEGL